MHDRRDSPNAIGTPPIQFVSLNSCSSHHPPIAVIRALAAALNGHRVTAHRPQRRESDGLSASGVSTLIMRKRAPGERFDRLSPATVAVLVTSKCRVDAVVTPPRISATFLGPCVTATKRDSPPTSRNHLAGPSGMTTCRTTGVSFPPRRATYGSRAIGGPLPISWMRFGRTWLNPSSSYDRVTRWYCRT